MSGDFILINKLKFYYRSPQRGEIAVFSHPSATSGTFVKRIIAMPGDRIAIKADEIYINGKKLDRRLVTDPHGSDGHEYYLEHNGPSVYRVRYNPNHFFRGDLAEKKLASNQYFVLGDNRDYSYDSRFWGTVPLENFIGSAVWVWFSYTHDQINQQILWRMQRLLKRIE